MSIWLGPTLAGGLVMAGVSGALARRARLIPPLLLVLTAVGISLVLVHSLTTSRPSAVLSDGDLGGAELARLPLGVLVGAWAALLLELGVARRPRLGG
ncbi:MAG: hypothetical protein WA695_05425, partial [Candidatus Dormiibacterota bacterium]